MNLKDLMENMTFLILGKIVVFVCITLFATCYLIPQGIVHYRKWKETQKVTNLASSINCIACGIFILLYFLAMVIIDSLKAWY